MALTDIGELPPRGRVLIDSAPIICFLEGHRELAPRYAPLFECPKAGDYELVVTTVTLAEVLTGMAETSTRWERAVDDLDERGLAGAVLPEAARGTRGFLSGGRRIGGPRTLG